MGNSSVLATEEFDEGPAIEVREHDGCKGVFAKESIAKNSVIFYLKGTVSTQPAKYTIQLGNRRHLNVPALRETNDELGYCWQYLNHCCEPNGYINTAESTFRALRNIAAGEEITFNYLTTESDMAVPFTCCCGAANCFGLIQGRNFLNPAESKRLTLAMGDDNLVTLLLPASPKPGRKTLRPASQR